MTSPSSLKEVLLIYASLLVGFGFSGPGSGLGSGSGSGSGSSGGSGFGVVILYSLTSFSNSITTPSFFFQIHENMGTILQ
jgi:hypothetical protein